MEITGVGDPSGRGLGFSYARATPKASVSSAVVKKKAVAGRGGSTVTGTDADLRRLSMEAAREVCYFFNDIVVLFDWSMSIIVVQFSTVGPYLHGNIAFSINTFIKHTKVIYCTYTIFSFIVEDFPCPDLP